MPRVWAACSAEARSREAIATTSLHSPFCIAGTTLFTAIEAVLRIPHRTLLDIGKHHSCKASDHALKQNFKVVIGEMEAGEARWVQSDLPPNSGAPSHGSCRWASATFATFVGFFSPRLYEIIPSTHT